MANYNENDERMDVIKDTTVTNNFGATENFYDYRSIASTHKLAFVSFLLYVLSPFPLVLFALTGSMGGFSIFLALFLLLYFAVCFGCIIVFWFSVVRLARLLRWDTISTILCWLIGGGLLLLWFVNGSARRILKEAGYEVSWLGADMRQFPETTDGRITDEFLGFILGAVLFFVIAVPALLFHFTR